jgi:hypothetical protein
MAKSGGRTSRPPGDYQRPSTRSQARPPEDSNHLETPAKRRPKATVKKRSQKADDMKQNRSIEAEDPFVILLSVPQTGLTDELIGCDHSSLSETPLSPYRDCSKPKPTAYHPQNKPLLFKKLIDTARRCFPPQGGFPASQYRHPYSLPTPASG